MYCVSVNLTSEEWVRIIQRAVSRHWPQTLSRSEIVRRYTLIGISTFRDAVKRSTDQLEQPMFAPGESKLCD